ncbi:MAG: DUF3073 domain-containing protein [Candidatus Nanopelagicales bacterium]
MRWVVRTTPDHRARGSSMGRGRAKAKQTKVARRLKYSGPDTDLSALEAELKGDEDIPETPEAEVDDDPYDPYAKYQDDYDEDDDTR